MPPQAKAVLSKCLNPEDELLKTFYHFHKTTDIDGFITFLSDNKHFLEKTLNKKIFLLLQFYRCNVVIKTLKLEKYVSLSDLKKTIRCDKVEDVLTVVSMVSAHDLYFFKNLRLEFNRFITFETRPYTLLSTDLPDVIAELLAYNPTGPATHPIDIEAVIKVLTTSAATNPNDIIQIYRSTFDILRNLNISKDDLLEITRQTVLQCQTSPTIVFVELFLLTFYDAEDAEVVGPLVAKVLETMATRPIVRNLKILNTLRCVKLSVHQQKIVDCVTEGNLKVLSMSFRPGALLNMIHKNTRILQLIAWAVKRVRVSLTEIQSRLCLPIVEEIHNFLIEQNHLVKIVHDEVGCLLVSRKPHDPSTFTESNSPKPSTPLSSP